MYIYIYICIYIYIYTYIHTYEIALFSFLDRVSIYLCASMFTCVVQVSHTRMNILLLHNIIFNGHIMLADKMVNRDVG